MVNEAFCVGGTANGFDVQHTLSLAFISKSEAAYCQNFKMRGCIIRLCSATSNILGAKLGPQVARHYAKRLLGTEELDIKMLHLAFSRLSGEQISDIRGASARGLAENDNVYWTFIFSQFECPRSIRNVTSILIGSPKVILLHYQRMVSAPF